jgi:four helix bundle protein
MTRDELEARAAKFGRDVRAVAEAASRRFGGARVATQLLDAATSVGANYRASRRARSRAEFVAKLGIVNEEADEAVYWLDYIADTGLACGPQLENLRAEARELRAIFAAAYRTARGRRRRPPDEGE